MNHELKSFLYGAAVAALLIVPTLAHGETSPPAPPPAVSAPAEPDTANDEMAHAIHERARAVAKAAREQARKAEKAAHEQVREATGQARAAAAQARREAEKSKAIMIADASNNGWVVWPKKSYDVQSLRIDDVVGSIRIDVKDSGPAVLTVSGTKGAVDALDVDADGGVLRIDGTHDSTSVWDWRRWFDFSNLGNGDRSKLNIQLTVPRGSDVRIEDLIGSATIGDLNGSLRLEAAATRAKIGKVKDAHIEMNGSGRVDIAEVTGPLHLEIAGSGKVTAGSVGRLSADLAGSGDAVIGAINGSMDLDIAGSGSLTATRVNGAMNVSIAGAGSVKIADGVADPFKVDIMGSGDVVFGGMAVNPSISALGSGSVKIKAYRGHLSSDGMANVKIGE